jgi:Carboxypeptidase regulatory-like domain
MSMPQIRIGLFTATLLFTSGCGNDLTAVSGKVTMDGKPLPNAIVTFFPVKEGGSATGQTDDTGSYKLIGVLGEGLKPGSYKVAVTTAQTAVAESSDIDMNSPEYLALSSGVGMESVMTKAPKEPIPAKYNSSTEIVKEITAGTTQIDLELTSK